MSEYICDICTELSGTAPEWVPGTSRILAASSNFAITPTLGSIIPGYMLVWSLEHVSSMANLEGDRSELTQILAELRQHVAEEYGMQAAIFEHGMDASSPSGGCVDHAHLHVFPCSPDLALRIEELQTSWTRLPWEKIHELRGRGYLLFEPPNTSEPFVSIVEERIPSQAVRRLIAASSGEADQWDWAVFPFLSNMEKTMDTWRRSAQSERDDVSARRQAPTAGVADHS